MWSLALPTLSALMVSVVCQCLVGLEPLNKTVRLLEFPGTLSWREVDRLCEEQWPLPDYFEMLRRDFVFLPEADSALCRGQSVPLGLEKTEFGPIVWRRSTYSLEEEAQEEVSSRYSQAQAREFAGRNVTLRSGVGALDRTSGQWRLVGNETGFACALCQRAWVGSLHELYGDPPPRPSPFRAAFAFSLQKAGQQDNADIEETLHLLVHHLNQSGIKVEVEVLASDPGDDTVTSVRVKSSALLTADRVSTALNGSHLVVSWRDMDRCPAERLDGFEWQETLRGLSSEVRLPEFQLASKRCWIRMRADGDYDAIWDEEVLFWIDRWEECNSKATHNLVRRLEEFASQTAANLELKALVKITSGVPDLYWPPDSFYSTRNSLSNALLTALSLLSVANDNQIASSACNKDVCAFLTAQDPNGADVLYFSHENAPPRFLHSSDIENVHQTFDIAFLIPSQLSSTSRVALHTVNSQTFGPKPFLRPRKNVVLLFKQAVYLHMTSAVPIEAWASDGEGQMTVYVNNTGAVYLFRHLSVWSLGENEESSLPCPLVRSDNSIDTFFCNKFVSGQRDLTAATFLAFSRARSSGGVFYSNIVNVFNGYTQIAIERRTLQVVAKLTSYVVKKTPFYKTHDSDFGSRLAVHKALETILSGVVLNDTVAMVNRPRVKVIVSDLTGRDPVVGLSLARRGEGGDMQAISAGKRNISSQSAMDFVVSANVEENYERLAMLLVSDFADFYPTGSLGAHVKKKLMVVHLVVTSRSMPDGSAREDFYLDIHLHRERVYDEEGESEYEEDHQEEENEGLDDEIDSYNEYYKTRIFNKAKSKEEDKGKSTEADKTNRRFLVATWSDDDKDWHVANCAKLRSTRDSKTVFRCSRLAFIGHDSHGRFLIFEPNRFADVIGDALLAILIAAGVLSIASLTSIAGTAIALPSWRQDLGHKFLLHMTLALTFNLAIGFTNSLVSFDTESAACVVVGALRHFSYLAMFAWMLAMSGLQLRRLLSVLGARATPKLLLKVSLVAWCLPTVAVVGLVTFNSDMYRSDKADRGFCYPEGGDFVWTVQVPAATVLTLNAVIFVVILARVFGFRGWGETEDLHRHLKESTFQLRRLRAVFFTFCLFGISWVFHLLAEEGVFQEKYVYEYLFLMTASLHVFSLACMFVIFDGETRREWCKLIDSLRAKVNRTSDSRH